MNEIKLKKLLMERAINSFKPINMEHVKKGDKITRMMGGFLPDEMYVGKVDDDFIYALPLQEEKQVWK